MATDPSEGVEAYGPIDIHLLERREAIRKRPGMYVGDVGPRGLHLLLFQLLTVSLSEFAEGQGSTLDVLLHADGSVTVADEGRGIPVTHHPDLGMPILQVLLTGAEWGRHVPDAERASRDSWPLTVANCLAEWLRVETRYGGQAYRQEYRRGEPVTAPQPVGPCQGAGVRLTFKPDATIFRDPEFSYAALRDRVREFAFLNSSLRISVTDERTGAEEVFRFADGIAAFVRALNQGRHPLHPEVLVIQGERAGVRFEVGLQYCRERTELLRSFVNNQSTLQGGMHVTGVRAPVTRSLNALARPDGWCGARLLRGADTRRGMTGVISVRLAEPRFAGATRGWLANLEVRRVVGPGVGRFLDRFFAQNPATAEVIRLAAHTNPEMVLDWLSANGRVSDRKLRLFACACVRQVWPLLTDERSRQAVVTAERAADGLVGDGELAAAAAAARRARQPHRPAVGPGPARRTDAAIAWVHAVAAARETAGAAAPDAARRAARRSAAASAWSAAACAEHTDEGCPVWYSAVTSVRSVDAAIQEEVQCRLLDCIFGPPFGPLPSLDPSCATWHDGTVRRLAEAIYNEGAFHQLPVLGDALEEAGCQDECILGHCRQPLAHVRGCWIVDLVLGKK